jgi:hypothetical protein
MPEPLAVPGRWLRNGLELAAAVRACMWTSGSSFGTFFLWRGGQVDHESIQHACDVSRP